MSFVQSAAALRRLFQNKTTPKTMLAGASPSTDPLIAGKAGYTLFVQRIEVSITTDAAQTLTFQDSADTPVVLAAIAASPGLGRKLLLENDEGVPCTEGKDLDLVASAAGLAGQVLVEAYLKPTATLEPSGV
jgi:hypothetical protein